MRLVPLQAQLRSVTLIVSEMENEASRLIHAWEDKAEGWRNSTDGQDQLEAVEEIVDAVDDIKVKAKALDKLLEQHRNIR